MELVGRKHTSIKQKEVLSSDILKQKFGSVKNALVHFDIANKDCRKLSQHMETALILYRQLLQYMPLLLPLIFSPVQLP